MAYEIAGGVLEQYPIMQRIEVRLIHSYMLLTASDPLQRCNVCREYITSEELLHRSSFSHDHFHWR
jgi:hypothetical protein